jgi:5'-3' exonuclease
MSEEEYDEEIIQWLRRSREQVGELEPVYATPEGEVIDGKHRLKAYPGWKTQTVQVDDLRKIVERIHRNIHRKMSKNETKKAVIQLALALEKSDIPKEFLVDEIKKHLPFSEDYIRSMLPAKFKREYRKKEKPAVKFPAEEPTTPTTPKSAETKHFLTCPVCGSKLVLKGDVLLPA